MVASFVVANHFHIWLWFNNNMATETALEQQRRIAAENDDFQTWRNAYLAERDIADEWGGGLINGRPAAVVVPNDPTSDSARQPLPGQGERERAARTSSVGNNPDLVYANAERISREMAPRHDDNNKVVAQSYNSFLADRGMDPNTIGGARLYTDEQGNRRFNAPSIDDEYEAINLQNRVSGQNARTRIAANRLRDRNPLAAAELMNDLSVSSLARGGRSSEDRRAVALDYLQQQRDRINQVNQARQRAQSNGFSSPDTGIGPRRYWDRVANIA